jgi:hypothetical protein
LVEVALLNLRDTNLGFRIIIYGLVWPPLKTYTIEEEELR